ncbi:hypothetical protein NIZ92_11450 [Alcaligenes sp. 1735tsa3]|uniref:hypothetical protein n=1 Tax=Alcaligenes sp. 1735tsa3 TaxID=2953809 RepID=UPI0020A805C1|nr:hypothetical protein [Alcaligenes sp. 1735tsa3]USY23939.1 hypothetical protein NIZ92_11450 [Alcaligenes sp. 1735tsa3]
MGYGFQFWRPTGEILFDTNWSTLGLTGKYSADDPLASRDPALSLANYNRLDAYRVHPDGSATVYVYESVSGKPVLTNRGFQFWRPDGTLIASSDYPPMKVVDFKRITEDNASSQTVLVPPGRAYAIIYIGATSSGYAFDIQKHGAGPPTWEEWWSYRWRNLAIRPSWNQGSISFSVQQWNDPGIHESDTGTIQPVDQYLRYDCMVIDVTGA